MGGIKLVFQKVREQAPKTIRRAREPDIDKQATQAITERAKDKPAPIDKLKPEENREKIEDSGKDIELPNPKQEAEIIIRNKLRVRIVDQELDTPAFFGIRDTDGGAFFLRINRNHPFHRYLIRIISQDESDSETKSDEKELRKKLQECEDAIKLILVAYARMELEYDGKMREQAKDVRHDWGRIAKYFFKEEE